MSKPKLGIGVDTLHLVLKYNGEYYKRMEIEIHSKNVGEAKRLVLMMLQETCRILRVSKDDLYPRKEAR